MLAHQRLTRIIPRQILPRYHRLHQNQQQKNGPGLCLHLRSVFGADLKKMSKKIIWMPISLNVKAQKIDILF